MLERLWSWLGRRQPETETTTVTNYRYAGDPEPTEGGIEGVSDPPVVVQGKQLSYPDDPEAVDGGIEGISDPPVQVNVNCQPAAR